MQTIINHIKAEDALGNIEICKIDDQNIFIMDYAGFEKYFNFHIVPPTKEWLASRFLWAPSAEKYKKQYQDNIINLLLSCDPAMLINLRYIIFVADETDVPYVEEATNCEDEAAEFPQIIDFDENNCLGCFWYTMSSIVISMRAIEKTAHEITIENENANIYTNEQDEIDIGVYTTITHELRHLGLANPFLPEDKYPVSDESEQNVEEWGITAYENWRRHK